MTRLASWPLLAILCITCALYFPRLATAPIYLGGDEARFAIDAHALASTGRDLNGDRMPLFFHLTDSTKEANTRWYQPTLFYLIALVLKFRPLSEAAIRLPTAALGVVDVLLIYLVAMRLFSSVFFASLAALTMALTPAHFIFSRQALDYLCPLPFVLGWLICLLEAVESGGDGFFLAAGLMLGIGCYSYIAAWMMMPLYLVITWLATLAWAIERRPRRGSVRPFLAAAVGFAFPVLVAVPWLWSHPGMWRDTAARYGLYDAHHLSPLQGARDFLNYNNVQERISVFWDYFNPAYLFFSGGSNLTNATRRAGVFLLPLSVFLACGIAELLRRRRKPASIVLLAGLVVAPAAATLVDERYAVQRELFVLPFAVLISVLGVAWLLRQPPAAVRLATFALLAAMPVQYAFFNYDYFTDYRRRSAYWFDPIDFRDVAEFVFADDAGGGVPEVYFSRDLDDGAARWDFYVAKHGRLELMPRTRYIDAAMFDGSDAPSGSLAVFYSNDPKVPVLLKTGDWSLAKAIVHAGGATSAVVLRKTAARRPSASSSTAMNMNISGCTVTLYRILVRTGASVAGKYRISRSGRPAAWPCRQAMTTPATNDARNSTDAMVAAA